MFIETIFNQQILISMLDSVYHIRDESDLHDVERRVTELCKGTHGRCGLLRSTSYGKLRLAALYRPEYDIQLHQAVCGPVRILLQNRTIHLYYDTDINITPEEHAACMKGSDKEPDVTKPPQKRPKHS